ncbi:MAG: hypothetical protein LBV67_00645 [Streptococcaceae bacterium]|nr:hypothetical protein [Streptococcaceae bacterium]
MNEELQLDYSNSRKLAQSHDWEKHIELVKSMLPKVAYLEQDDFMSRLLGRLAWSYIRLDNKKIAPKLLKCSEDYDLWQAAANYFWACEYSLRQMNMTNLAKDCLIEFRKTIKKIENFSHIELPVDDLELAVMFYEKLIEHEEKSEVFLDKSAKSDVARFYELKARLLQDASGYEIAEEYYKSADLHPYATCCQAFRLMSEAKEQSEVKTKKEKLHEANEALSKNVFVDDYIRDLLIKFIDLRLALCDLHLNNENEKIVANDISKQVELIGKIYKEENVGFSKLSIKIPSFFGSNTYKEFSKMMNELTAGLIDFYNSNEIIKIDGLLNKIQEQLPSYTFSISKK